MALLEIKDLSFFYQLEAKPALKNISLTINEGDFIVLCGSTGSGKTTFLKLLKREISPFGKREGEILYQSQPLELLSNYASASEIGYVFQNPSLQIVTDLVYSELAFGLENLGIDSNTIRRKVGEMASFFGIVSWFNQKTSELSGGQKQILNLASIMVMQPKILLLDEPTAQLDPIAAKEFIEILKRLNQELGLSVIICEHRLEDVFPLADKVMVMHQGEMVSFDNPKNLGKNIPFIDLPSSVKIFNGLNIIDECPLTVREGKMFLSKHFKNDIKQLDIKPFIENRKPIIDIKDIWFRYEKSRNDIIKGLNFKIFEGEILSIVGANGSGKSTLFKLISGNKSPYLGKIKKYNQSKISYLPQNPQDLFVENLVLKELEEVNKYNNISKDEFKVLLETIITELDLKPLLNKHPYDLSGGEQQRLALGKVLLVNPNIILLDENYSYAVVAGNNFKFLWILSRTPQMDQNTYDSLIQQAKARGFEVEKIKITPQICFNG